MKNKTCPKCNKKKSIEDFPFSNKQKGTRQPYCKICCRANSKADYKKSRQSYLRRSAARKEKLRPLARQKVRDYLRKHPCIDCGESDPIVLEFDHVEEKKKCVSEMLDGNYTWEQIKEEIVKCEIRCANCHRRKTAKQFG